MIVLMSVVMVVTVLVVAKALSTSGIHRGLRRPLLVEQVLRLARRPDAEEAAEPITPAGGAVTPRTADPLGHRRGGKDLLGGPARVAAVVNERHGRASGFLAFDCRRRRHDRSVRLQDAARLSQLGTRQME
jgi:hypothetical protein